MILLVSTHVPGKHCGSTALRDLVNYYGFGWNESLCFGLGAGLGIWYLQEVKNAPSRLVHVRSHDLEAQFFKHIDHEFAWETFSNPEQGDQVLQAHLLDKRPALIQTDIYYLPYFHSKTHFPGHAIVVWGYDEQTRSYQVSDTERPGLIEVPARDLTSARFVPGGFFSLHGNMFAPAFLLPPQDLPGAIRKAIVYNSQLILDRSLPYQGLVALETWEEDLESWPALEDWKWTARFCYQVIERRGTGGGGFRLIYKEFLKQAEQLLPEVYGLGLVSLMAECARSWQELALALKRASEQDKPDFSEVKNLLALVRIKEGQYHERALHLGGN